MYVDKDGDCLCTRSCRLSREHHAAKSPLLPNTSFASIIIVIAWPLSLSTLMVDSRFNKNSHLGFGDLTPLFLWYAYSRWNVVPNPADCIDPLHVRGYPEMIDIARWFLPSIVAPAHLPKPVGLVMVSCVTDVAHFPWMISRQPPTWNFSLVGIGSTSWLALPNKIVLVIALYLLVRLSNSHRMWFSCHGEFVSASPVMSTCKFF